MLANLAILAILMQITSPEMGLQRVGEFGDFYTNYIIRDGSNVLASLAIFMQITSPEMGLQRVGEFYFVISHRSLRSGTRECSACVKSVV